MKTHLSLLLKGGYTFTLRSNNSRPVLIILLWLPVYFSSLAQTKLWEKTYGGNQSDGLARAQQTSDGGHILGGTSSSGISGDKTEASRGEEDYWIVKLNLDGSKAWDKTFGGNKSDYLASVQQSSDGGYILGGYSYSGKSGDKTENNKGDFSTDYWIVKLNTSGQQEWDKTLGGTESDFIVTVQQTSDRGFILGGYSGSGISGDKSQGVNGSWDYWVVKLKEDGSKEWDKTFGGNESDALTSLIVTPDDGFLLGGYSASDKSGDKSESKKSDCTDDGGSPCLDYWVVKITSEGTKEWDKTFGGYEDDVLNALALAPDGGYLLGGLSESGKSIDKSEPARDDTEDDVFGDYWVIKIGKDGSKIWDKTFGGNKYVNLTSLLTTPDGGYLLSGFSNSDRGGDMGIRRGIGNTWVVKIDTAGTKLWDTSLESGSQLLPTSNGSILLTGNFSGYPNSDYWLVKLQIPNKNAQTLTFFPPDKALTNSPIILTASASSGLPVTYTLISGPAIQNGNQLSFTGYGTVVVRAFQAGDATYSPVEYTTSFRVQRLTPQNDKTIGGNGSDILADMVATADGGYLLAGSSSSDISGDKSMVSKGDSDYWLVKTDKDKNKIWDKSFGGKGIEKLATIISIPDGGYLLGGYSTSDKEGDKSEGNKGKNDFWIVKIDANGTKLWDKTIGGNKDDNLAVIVATPDGGFLLGGSSQSGKSGDKSEENKGTPYENGYIPPDIWLVKIDGNGNKVWDKTYGSQLDDVLTSLIAMPDGNYLIGGNIVYSFNYLLIKIDTQGQQIWEKTFDYSSDNNGYIHNISAMITLPDGGYLLAGIAGFESYYYWIAKLDSDGNKIWDKLYGGRPIFTCYTCEINRSTIVDIQATSTDHYLLAGYTHSNQGGDRSEANRGRQDYWLVEIDANGQKIADKSFGGHDTDQLTAIIATSNGGYLLGGYSSSNTDHEKSENSKGDLDFWLIETQISAFPPSSLQAWNLRYGGSNSDYLTTVIKTNDGGYLLGGYSYSNKSGDKSQDSYGKSDYWVVRTDAAGNKLWDKRYGGTKEDYLKSIAPTADGGFLLGGGSESGISGNKKAINKGGRDIWVVKISRSGEKEWEQSYGGQETEDLQKIIALPDGTYLLAGYSNSPVGGDKTQVNQGNLDYWLVKINMHYGHKIWDKTYGGTANDYVADVLVLNNGDLLVGGTSFSSVSGDKSQGNQGSSDYWLLRTDKVGKKLWDNCYGGKNQDQLLAMLSPNTSTFLLAGHSDSGISGQKTQANKGDKDFWLVQVNNKGEKKWDKTYGGSSDENLRSLILDKDGGYVLGGTSFSGNRGDKSEESQGSSDYWLVKTNNKGKKLWDKRYGGSNEEELRVVWTTEDGGYLLGGRSKSDVSGDRTQPSQGENDFWLVKVAPVTSTISLAAAHSDTFTPKELTSAELLPLTAYPNPFVQEVNISFRVPQTQKITLKVYDSQGQEIVTLFEEVAQGNQTYTRRWKASHSSPGIYTLRLQSNTHQSYQKVFLTQ
ncbi:T9SS type A sorting domain-containing protein [Adhaeribacter radiodurans]|uniref:T9SS type A sorting domain-containing protein n=1 Tax=Adhaeribacter radiodurans TaxID=2745197 RepID=A0A7L7L433_9BACT|nr:T9SS type A sorting domain-containing protein [Adhaeribacter radiodurans]QMU27540.1 T9SS type A sorting domain-containing protein [Adhaeribacter radiodurans]